jgi:hypothetical protein
MPKKKEDHDEREIKAIVCLNTMLSFHTGGCGAVDDKRRTDRRMGGTIQWPGK